METIQHYLLKAYNGTRTGVRDVLTTSSTSIGTSSTSKNVNTSKQPPPQRSSATAPTTRSIKRDALIIGGCAAGGSALTVGIFAALGFGPWGIVAGM